MNKQVVVVGGIILAVVFAVVVMMKGISTTPSVTPKVQIQVASPQAAGKTVEETDQAKMAQGVVKNVSIEASNFKFSLPSITVKKGETVKITFTNKEGMHNFMLDEFNVKSKTIQAGQSDTVQFVADKSGSFEYYCSISNHRAMGMKGTLVVE
jgi:nitrosocyanin